VATRPARSHLQYQPTGDIKSPEPAQAMVFVGSWRIEK
jgi:hypothetical protein